MNLKLRNILPLKIIDPQKQDGALPKEQTAAIVATRHNLQLGRRFFHMSMGVITASCYALLFSHTQAVYLLGFGACCLYLFEQIRINYPELARKLNPLTSYILRAEEQLEESAAIPYAIALLLTIMTFPKIIAIAAIFTLALADPASAIIGIRFGKKKLIGHKSIAGSLAFCFVTFLCVFLSFEAVLTGYTFVVFGLAVIIALLSSFFEMLPIKLDDNLTIPLFVASSLLVFTFLLDIPTV